MDAVITNVLTLSGDMSFVRVLWNYPLLGDLCVLFDGTNFSDSSYFCDMQLLCKAAFCLCSRCPYYFH